jgi:DNA-binding GntR family transcriptional regulator
MQLCGKRDSGYLYRQLDVKHAMPVPTTPLYFRIQEMLRSQIASGALADGEQLPSETALAENFDTTRGTVRQALAQLTFEGLITRRAGLGTFVADRRIESRIEAQPLRSFEEQMEERGVHVDFRVLGFDREQASVAVATSLAIPSGSSVYRLRRLRLVRGEILGMEDRSMPERIGGAIPASALVTRPATIMVEAALGTPLGGMSVSVGAMAAQAETARVLGIRRGSPVLVRSHTFFDQSAKPVLTGESIYCGDKYRFTYRYGQGLP